MAFFAQHAAHVLGFRVTGSVHWFVAVAQYVIVRPEGGGGAAYAWLVRSSASRTIVGYADVVEVRSSVGAMASQGP